MRLFDEIRTFFERNWRRASRAKPNARPGRAEKGVGKMNARPALAPLEALPLTGLASCPVVMNAKRFATGAFRRRISYFTLRNAQP